MPHVTIDGEIHEASAGERLIDLFNRSGVNVPHVCYHPQLGPIQTCDTCLVEVDGALVRACATEVGADIAVSTASAAAKTAQREAFDRILSNHVLYCTVCDNNNGNCIVHNTTKLLAIENQRAPFRPKPYAVDHSNPFYRYDPDQCILCGRCVEACQNVQVNETLSIRWEDPHPRVLWDGGAAIGESSCVSCGHCVTVCPCNALMETTMLGHAGFMTALPTAALKGMIDVVKSVEPEIGYGPIMQISQAEAAMREARIRRTKTVCTYCGVGCSFDIWTKDRHILKVEPAEGPANGISTCVKGKFVWDYVNSSDRLTTPLIRDGDGFRSATWDEALDLVARRLGEVKAANGPDSIGLIASSKCTNEESYLMQKLARAVIGTNNVDNCSRYCQAPATTGLFRTVGYGGDSGSITDIEQASLVVIIGSNTAESHPVLATRVKRAHKLRGQQLIVADRRENEMARRADVFMRTNAGTDLVWLSAISRYLLDHGLAKREFLDRWVNGLEAYHKSLAPFTLESAAGLCGVSVETLEQVAQTIAAAERVCILWAMGVTQQVNGSDTSTAISNLLLLTGNYMRPGTGAYPLRGHNNVQGASDNGSMPNVLPGYQSVDDPQVRARFEAAWHVALPTTAGLDNHEMVNAIHQGKLKAMYLFGEEIGIVDSNANYVEDGLAKLDFFVVQDIFFGETCRFADVVLPAAPSLEKEGTFTSTERRIQRLYQVFEPLEGSRPDWQILLDLANRLGAGWHYEHPAEIMREIAAVTPLFAGVSYERLEGYKSLQWPVAADGSDQPLLYTKQFALPDGKARLFPVAWTPPAEQPDAEFDLRLNNGRLLEHFHEGNLTYRSDGIRAMTPDTFVEVPPQLAAERGLQSGTWVELTSRYGQVRVRALVTDRVHGKDLYMPMNSTESPVNRLTSSHTDPVTHTPAFKEAVVRMRVLPEVGESPLPCRNHRFGHPTPQSGVEVERKWERPGYHLPGTASEPATTY
jgi:formate dehydrogenase major subunit